MKIIQVVHSFPPRYEGIGIYCYQLSKYLAQRGHQVDVFTSRFHRSLPVQEVRDGFTIHRCLHLGVLRFKSVTFIFNKLIREEVDVVHAHSYLFLTSIQAALARRINQQPLLLHLHGGMELFPPKKLLPTLKFQVKKIYNKTVGKWTLQSADAIASVSKRDIPIAQRRFHIEPRFFHWIPNIVDVNLFNRCNSSSASSNIIFIGKLEYGKGIDVLIRVMKLVLKEEDNITFTIVGEGLLKRWIQNVAKTFRGRVRILGQVDYARIPNLLSNATILLLPSYSEGLPTVCLEALASKVPVVASNVGGTSEVVIDGETGYLFPPGNAQLCAEKLMRLLANETIRNKMGRRGRSLVEQFYTGRSVVEKTEKIYESIGSA